MFKRKIFFIFLVIIPIVFTLIIIGSSARAQTAASTKENSGLGEQIEGKMQTIGAPYNPAGVGFGEGQKNSIGLYGLAVGLITSFIGVMFFVMTIIGGIQWMTAGGNEEQVAGAKKRVINGIIGIGIILSAYIITYFILSKFTSVTGVQTGFL